MRMKKIFKTLVVIISLSLTNIIPVAGVNIFHQNFTYNEISYDQNITNLMTQYNVPGFSACVVKDDEVIWSKGYGYYNRLHFLKKPDGDTIYGAGCLTTTITVTALLQLYEKGLFNLSDDVSDYLDFKLRNPNYPEISINFSMLLTHQSGLSLYLGSSINMKILSLFGFLKNPYYNLKDNFDVESKHYNPELWLNIQPGENASYSCIGIMLSAFLVERISGQPFDDYCKEHIFEPLDMKISGFNTRSFKRRNLAVPYFPLFSSLAENKFAIMVRMPHVRGCHPMRGSTGLFTTTNDLSHFLIAHMNGGIWKENRILNESTVDLMHSIHVYNVSIAGSDSNFWAYGFGWNIYNESGTIYQGHGGDDGWGFSSSMTFRDSDNIGVIMLLSARDEKQYNIKPYLKDELYKIAEELIKS